MKNPEKEWEAIMHSIRKAAHILNEDLTERDMPEYQNWFVARDMHNNLWARVRSRRKKGVMPYSNISKPI